MKKAPLQLPNHVPISEVLLMALQIHDISPTRHKDSFKKNTEYNWPLKH